MHRSPGGGGRAGGRASKTSYLHHSPVDKRPSFAQHVGNGDVKVLQLCRPNFATGLPSSKTALAPTLLGTSLPCPRQEDGRPCPTPPSFLFCLRHDEYNSLACSARSIRSEASLGSNALNLPKAYPSISSLSRQEPSSNSASTEYHITLLLLLYFTAPTCPSRRLDPLLTHGFLQPCFALACTSICSTFVFPPSYLAYQACHLLLTLRFRRAICVLLCRKIMH